MKRIRLVSLCAVLPALAAFVLTGCATAPQTAANISSVQIETLPSAEAHIRLASAHQQGENLIIQGKVRRNPDNCCDKVTGHVDIVVFSPEGDMFDITNADYSPRNIPKSGTKSSSFSMALPYTLPAGYSLTLQYHDSLDCNQDALPTFSLNTNSQS